jgi:hypothetical protein
MSVEGVDYAFSQPDIPQLAAAGKVFACRYGGPGTEGKWLRLDEAMELAANGIGIVANAEGSASGLLGGYSVGVSWAKSALSWFRSCGMPDGRPVYLSVDFDVTSAQWPVVADALRGAGSVLGPQWVGVYGGRRAIEWAARDGVAKWYWQTYAWSGGYWVPGVHIQQYRNGVQLAGADCDLNRGMVADYGQWTPVGAMTEDDVGFDNVYTNKDGNKRTVEQMIVDLFDGSYTDAYAAAFPTSISAGIAELKARPPVQAAPIDPAALKAVLLDPEVLAAIAKAVTDEIGS